MKRAYIAGALLAICVAFCLISYHTITKDCKALITQSEQIDSSAKSGELKAAEQQAKELKAMWKQYSLPFSLLTTHFHYDTLEECVDKLYHACQAAQKKEITAASDDLIFEATHIITSIAPKAENVF